MLRRRATWRIASLGMACAALGLLAACFRLDHEGPVSDSVNFVVDRFVDRPKPPMQPLEPIYCYRTLAAVDCSSEPALGDDRRLVGHYGPRPR